MISRAGISAVLCVEVQSAHHAVVGGSSMGTGMTALGTIARWFESVTPSAPDDDARAAVAELIPEGHELGGSVG